MASRPGGSIEAVILAAGVGSRFSTETPKMLAEVGGRTILYRMLEGLAAVGLERATIVLGSKAAVIREALAERPPPLQTNLIVNRAFKRPSIHSLHCAIRARSVDAPMLLLEGDLLLGPQMLQDLLDDPRADLVCFGRVRQSRPWLVKLAADGRIVGWGYDLLDADGEMIGVYKLSPETQRGLMEFTDVEFWDPLLDAGRPIYARRSEHAWAEVDTPDDLAHALLMWE